VPVYVKRREQFSAAHRLFNPSFSDAQNEAAFDKCNNVHGHNYTMEVTVAGDPDPATGYVIDLKLLSRILDAEILDKVDHKDLNSDVAFLRGQIPSAENLVVAFWNILAPKIPAGKLHCIRLWESDNNSVEYWGDSSMNDE
jgi:6-pyruvoyltetrahydropterin/6-carboxytetrahydropterin synthase